MSQPQLTLEQFERGDIDAAAFDHEAHVYAGWLCVMRYGRKEGIARFDAALRRLVKKVGAESKYNAMITWLFLVLIADRARADPLELALLVAHLLSPLNSSAASSTARMILS